MLHCSACTPIHSPNHTLTHTHGLTSSCHGHSHTHNLLRLACWYWNIILTSKVHAVHYWDVWGENYKTAISSINEHLVPRWGLSNSFCSNIKVLGYTNSLSYHQLHHIKSACTKTCFFTWLAFIHTASTHTLHIRLANTPTSLTTVHLLIRHPHPVADSSTILPLEFSRVRVTSTQVHLLTRSAVAGDAVWTVATLDDRCHQSSNVLWTIMTRWALFGALQDDESGGTRDQQRNTQLSWTCCLLCWIQSGFKNHGHLPPLSQFKASFLSRGLAPTAVPLKESQPSENSSSKINITTLNEYSTTY